MPSLFIFCAIKLAIRVLPFSVILDNLFWLASNNVTGLLLIHVIISFMFGEEPAGVPSSTFSPYSLPFTLNVKKSPFPTTCFSSFKLCDKLLLLVLIGELIVLLPNFTLL